MHQIRGVKIAEASKILDFIRFLECGERGVQDSVRAFVGTFITSNSKDSSLPRITFER